MIIDDALIAAYAATNYCVNDEDIKFVLRVGKYSAELDALYMRTNNAQAAFITAFNPFSKSLSDAENLERHQALVGRLSNRWPVYEGSGEDAQAAWPAERSLLILGISLHESLAIGREFDQNAIVYCDNKAIPILYLCDSDEPVVTT